MNINLDDLERDALSLAVRCPSDHRMCMPTHACSAMRPTAGDGDRVAGGRAWRADGLKSRATGIFSTPCDHHA